MPRRALLPRLGVGESSPFAKPLAGIHRAVDARSHGAAAYEEHPHRTQARPDDRLDQLADRFRGRVRDLAAGPAEVIRGGAVWLAVQPLDMRAGSHTALGRVVEVFGAARPHQAYLFAKRRARA
jgi:hypothetical protein